MWSKKKPKMSVSEYRMSTHMGFSYSVDEVLEVFVKEKSIWSGSSTANQTITISQAGLFGGVKKEGGLVGNIDVLHGRSGQVLPTGLATRLNTTPTQAPGFRDILSLFFYGNSVKRHGFYWSANQPYIHPVWLKVRRTSTGWYEEKSRIGNDMNPAHIVREVLTNNDWGLGIPADMIDNASFTAAADKLYDEGFGLSLQWAGQSSAEDFIGDVLAHIDGTYGTDPLTGKFYIKLIRGDYDILNLFELNEDNCTITSFVRNGLTDTSNEVVVTWTNPENESEETVTVHDIANYSAQGVLNSTSRNYHAIRSSTLALRAAMRELGKVSQPIATIEVTANREAIGIKSGDVVKINYPEYGLNGVPCRVMSDNQGRPGDMGVKLHLMEDVFQMPADAYASSDPSEWVEPEDDDGPITNYRVESTPYYQIVKETSDADASSLTYPDAYAMLLVDAPGYRYDVYRETTNSLGQTAFEFSGTRSFVDYSTLTSPVVREVTSTLAVSVAPEIGSLFFMGAEICVVESVGVGTIVARRGMLDTVPAEHAAGTGLWFFTGDSDIADDDASSVGATVRYKFVREGASADGATIFSATMTDRPYRPYRPANVKANGVFWPVVVTGSVEVTWAHRNRLLETSVLNKWDAGSVTVEPGTTYTLRIYSESGALLRTASGLTGTSYSWSTEATDAAGLQERVRVELEAVREGYVSLQKYNHTFDLAGYGRNYGNYYGGV